ncbi:MAG: hypothetical protein HQL82_10505 [Magnetococcales bacterium]|nr:hypothetical protein [Magnetococcales bacterium]
MKFFTRSALGSLATLLWPLSLSATELPVHSVALFSSGVGYFQHAGQVDGDRTLQLPFREDQINDVLKSLVLEDRAGGQPGFVVYPSRDPLAKTLGGFQVDFSDHPGMADLLTQLRGARVAIQALGEEWRGAIIGVEKRPLGTGEESATEDWVVNLALEQGLKSLFLRDVSRLDLLDEALRGEVAKALETLDQGRGRGTQRVSLRFPGQGTRPVQVGYVVETPVWKVSYRLILPAKEASPPRIQGWAIVENQTDNDWTGITLSLVSGRPISFVQDLYEPLYAQRPQVKTTARSGPAPREYESGVAAEEQADARQESPMEAAGPAMRMFKSAPVMANMDADLAQARDGGAAGAEPLDASGLVAAAAGRRQGALFQYTVPGVTLPRRQSAMIPIVAEPIAARPVGIFNATVLADHPLSGVWLENTTANHLPAGPVSLFERGGYAGDARLDELPPHQKRLLSFAVDLAVLVRCEAGPGVSQLTTGRLVKGVLELSHKHRRVRTCTVDNSDDRPRTLVVEHPNEAGWTWAGETPLPVESTVQWHRFETQIPARGGQKLAITEERVEVQEVALLHSGVNFLDVHVRNGQLSQGVRQALGEVLTLKRAEAALAAEMEAVRQDLQRLTEGQERLRSNLNAVRPGTTFANRMLEKLEASETRIEQANTRLEGLIQRHREARQRLEQHLAALNAG